MPVMTWYSNTAARDPAVISIAFILIVMSQTTKNEGLTGTIGGNISPNFKGKPGFEERLQGYTRYLGIAWFVVGIITGIAFRNFSANGTTKIKAARKLSFRAAFRISIFLGRLAGVLVATPLPVGKSNHCGGAFLRLILCCGDNIGVKRHCRCNITGNHP